MKAQLLNYLAIFHMIHKYKLGFYNKIGITFSTYFHSNTEEAGIEIKPSNSTFQKGKLNLYKDTTSLKKGNQVHPNIPQEVPPLRMSKISVTESYSNASNSIAYCL